MAPRSRARAHRSVVVAAREVMLVVGVIVAAGCIGARSSHRYETTRVTSANLVSRAPPLPQLVLRIAAGELALSPEQARDVDALARRAELAIRRIDQARAVFLEALARGVDAGRFDHEVAAAAGERLTRATDDAAPPLGSAIERLHAVLTPRQRATLGALVRGRIERWAPAWEASGGERRAHPWLSRLEDAEAPGEIELAVDVAHDTSATARAWIDAMMRRVGSDMPALDPAARRQLSNELRSDDWSPE